MQHSDINIQITELLRKDGVVIFENIGLKKINFTEIRDEIQKSINDKKFIILKLV